MHIEIQSSSCELVMKSLAAELFSILKERKLLKLNMEQCQ